MSYPIKDIEGIGPSHGAKLERAGIRTTQRFLQKCSDASGRSQVSETTGLSTKQLLEWANKADLMRIPGVGPQYSELLEASGVDTVKELRHRNAQNLATKIAEINAVKKLARRAPAVTQVETWIEEAKTTDPCISH